MSTLYFVLAMIISFLLGVMFTLTTPKKSDGVIRVNKSDPMKDTYTLELMISFGELDERKRIIFDVLKDD